MVIEQHYIFFTEAMVICTCMQVCACAHTPPQGNRAKETAETGIYTSKDVQDVLSHIPTDGLKVRKLEKVCCAQPLLNLIGSRGSRHNNRNYNKDPVS